MSQVNLKDGEIHAWMLFEVVATSKELTEESLQKHVDTLVDLKQVRELSTEYAEVSEIEQPVPNVEKGFSKICEVELVVSDFSEFVKIIINYAPTLCEILAPNKLTMDLATVQEASQSMIALMQKFMHAGVGGAIMTQHGPDQK